MDCHQLDAKAIFERAVELESASERSAFIEQSCGGRSELRAKIEALLKAYFDAGSFLEAGPPGLAPTADLPLLAERTGSIIGAYKLLQQIGEGGFGVVYMAEQTHPVRRKVALKVIKPGMDTREVIARFEAERQALALMDHPNIAKVLDGGATETGRPYFVMELVKGVPLTEFCDENRLDTRQRLELFATVCHAIQHAHQKGVIHRDIKPTNVMVTLHDGQPVPKVIDFGVAKAITQQLTARTIFTAYGQMIGTPQYMSPEQAEMSGLDIDTRSDVYSLGVLLYELLTGTTPLEVKSLRGKAYAELQRMIREEEAPRPSFRLSTLGEATASIAMQRRTDPKKLGAMVRGELDWIVMRALEKNRDRRYATASGFAADIARYLKQEAVEACPPSLAYKLRKFARRNRPVLVTGATITGILLAASIVSTWHAVRATRAEARVREILMDVVQERDRANRERDRAISAEGLLKARLTELAQERDRAKEAEDLATVESAIAQAISDFLQNDLLSQGSPAIQPDRDIKLRTVIDRAAESIGAQFAGQPLVEASIRHTLGVVYLSLGEYSKAELHLQNSLELYRTQIGEEHTNAAAVMHNLGGTYAAAGRFDESAAMHAGSLAIHQRLLGEEHSSTVISKAALGAVYREQGKYVEAEPLLVEALQIKRRTLGETHLSTLDSSLQLAVLYYDRGRYLEAEQLLLSILQNAEESMGIEHPFTMIVSESLARFYRVRKKYDLCEPLILKTLESRRRVLGAEHPHTLQSMATLARLYSDLGRYEEAESLVAAVVQTQRAALGDEHPDTLGTRAVLATVYQMQGRNDLAEPLLVGNLDTLEKIFGDDHPYSLMARRDLAVFAFNQGGDREAESLLDEVLESRRRVEGEQHPNTIEAMRELATALASGGRIQDAIRLEVEAAHGMLEAHPVRSYEVLHTASYLVWAEQEEEHARLAGRLLELAKDARDEAVCEHATRGVLLGPSPRPEQLQAAEAIARRAVDRKPGTWTMCDLGIVEYRLGRFSQAAEWLEKAEQTKHRRDRALIRAFQAMTAFRLDEWEQAREHLKGAEYDLGLLAIVDLQSPLGVGPDELAAWLALRQARAVMGIEASTTETRISSALNLQRELVASPADTHQLLHLAILQYWFHRDGDHLSLCREMLARAAASEDAFDCDRAAKAYLIRRDAADDPKLLDQAVTAAKDAVELGKGFKLLPWYQLAAGMANYRLAQFAEAESLLTEAQRASDRFVRDAALLFRAMARYRQGQAEQAQQDLAAVENVMPPPADRSDVSEAILNHDLLVLWLAYDEATELLNPRNTAAQ